MSEYTLCPISPSDRRACQAMDALLAQEGISRDQNLTYSVGLFDEEGALAATGSLYANTLRCLAVSREHQGEGLMAQIVAHLTEVQLARGNTHLFLYTKCESAKYFAPLGFYEIARVDGRLVFMENRRRGFARYLDGLRAQLENCVRNEAIERFASAVPCAEMVEIPGVKHEIYRCKNSDLLPYFTRIFEFLGL